MMHAFFLLFFNNFGFLKVSYSKAAYCSNHQIFRFLYPEHMSVQNKQLKKTTWFYEGIEKPKKISNE